MKEYKLNQPKYFKITNQENALKLIGGTSLKDRLIGWNYKQLTVTFGEPTFGKVSSDGKIQREWVFTRTSDNTVFTIYDWKEYRSLPMDEPIEFRIGTFNYPIDLAAKATVLNLIG